MKRSVFLLFLLAGCGSHAVNTSRPDEPYNNAMDTGRSVFDLGHSDQAEGQYRDALKRALLRDDASAIHDSGFNLATVLLDQDKPQESLESLKSTREALEIRNYPHTQDLSLVQAADLYRMHDYAGTMQVVQAPLSSGDVALRERAAYLNGLSAAETGNEGVLASMASKLGASKDTATQTDYQELDAHLALLRHDPAHAMASAALVVQKRRAGLDYGGMRRALLLEAQAADASGEPKQALALRKQEADSRSSLQAPISSSEPLIDGSASDKPEK
ncbi:hypothetical protein WH240_07040 [Gluconobacter wancherniae]|uniref:hypothetical protein n=1 Tax=Gluconobacter wancherniae TaxID=1307955 RepID=UPI0030AAEB80